jgi:hypothetical protein
MYNNLLEALAPRMKEFFEVRDRIRSLLGETACLPLGGCDDTGLRALLEFRRTLGLRDYEQTSYAEYAASYFPHTSSTLADLLRSAEKALETAAWAGRIDLLPCPGFLEMKQAHVSQPDFEMVAGGRVNPYRPPFVARVARPMMDETSPWRRAFATDATTLIVRIDPLPHNLDNAIQVNMAEPPKEFPRWIHRRHVFLPPPGASFTNDALASLRREREAMARQVEEARTAKEREEQAQRETERLRANADITNKTQREFMLNGGRRMY